MPSAVAAIPDSVLKLLPDTIVWTRYLGWAPVAQVFQKPPVLQGYYVPT